MDLHFYYDVVCPYAYIASTRVEALAAEAGVRLIWHPVLLGGLFREVGTPQDLFATLNPPKARLNQLDMHRQARWREAPFRFHPDHPRRTVEAMRALVAAGEARPALTHALYRAYWVEHRDLADRSVVEEIAAAHGVAAAALDDPAVKQGLFDETAEAAGHGAFGVPTFRLGEEIWWGADRLPLVRQALGLDPEPVPDGGRRGGRVAFFHDFSSPYSYLASTRIVEIAEAAGATLEWVPFLLGALFREIGTENVPILAGSEPKRRYLLKDMADQARWRGMPFRMSSHFPLRTVTALRVALQEPGVTPAIYRAAWAEDRNIGDKEVLQAVLDEAGFDGAALIAGTREPRVKERLKTNTDRARLAGACGAPTFLVDDRHLFWGQDRLEMVDATLRGWQPDAD